MTADGRTRWTSRAAIAAAALLLAEFAASAHAQGFMQSRIGGAEPRGAMGPRINPNMTGRAGGDSAGRFGGILRTPPWTERGPPVSQSDPGPRREPTPSDARPSSRLSASCKSGYRNRDGRCDARPVASDGGKGRAGKTATGGGGSNRAQDALGSRTVPNELVAELDGRLTDAQLDALARRHGVVRVATETISLLDATIGLFRITGNRPAETVRRAFAADAGVRAVQPNYRYALQEQKPASGEGDPLQYPLAQLRLPQAHALARGMNVTMAVIDSGIDAGHPELANSISDTFDALGSKEGPHAHGTAMAGAIAARAKLTGSAPEVRILAIRAFGAAAGGAESTSFVILRGLDYAVRHGAQIVNMSFAGPQDALIGRAVAAAAAKDVVLIAAAGNAGPTSPPLYPAAYPDVIAVSGTDARDRLIAASNRGSHIALAAPGADILAPVPDGKYQIISGTSVSAAYVSGIAALVLERSPALKPADVRNILTSTARDLGAPGRDDLFGAGEADALAAVMAAIDAAGAPLAAAMDKRSQPSPQPDGNNTSVSRALNDTAPSMASDESSAKRPDAQ